MEVVIHETLRGPGMWRREYARGEILSTDDVPGGPVMMRQRARRWWRTPGKTPVEVEVWTRCDLGSCIRNRVFIQPSSGTSLGYLVQDSLVHQQQLWKG
jgi:hypothetical protein